MDAQVCLPRLRQARRLPSSLCLDFVTLGDEGWGGWGMEQPGGPGRPSSPACPPRIGADTDGSPPELSKQPVGPHSHNPSLHVEGHSCK